MSISLHFRSSPWARGGDGLRRAVHGLSAGILRYWPDLTVDGGVTL